MDYEKYVKGLVSIITPCYNSDSYIGRYLNKMLKQTYPNVELIIIDDGSTDSTSAIIHSYMQKYNARGYSIRYYYQSNKGLGGAIQQGLRLVRGEYFCWCDSDNYYDDTYVEKSVSYMEDNPGVAVVRCDGFIVDDVYHEITGRMGDYGANRVNSDELFINCLLNKNFHFGCALIKTECFDRVCKNRKIYESRAGQNWQLLLPMFYSYACGYIDEPLFYFVNRADSLSHLGGAATYQKQIDQINEYQKIILTTLKSICRADYSYYSTLVVEKYTRERIAISFRNRDVAGFERSYKYLMDRELVCRKYRLMRIVVRHALLHSAALKMRKVVRAIEERRYMQKI